MAEVRMAVAHIVTGRPEADVEIRALAAGGSGVADLPDGRVVFVPRTAPGDQARIAVTRSKKRWAQGRVVELTTPAPGRVEPQCRLYHECGGCTLQHIGYDEQLRWKARFVSDALNRIGGLSVEEPEVVPSPAAYRYRNRVSYTLRRLRGGRVVAGFHALDRPAHVVDVEGQCLLPEEPLTVAWEALRRGWGTGAKHLPQGGRLTLTLRNTSDGVILVVVGGEPGWDPRALGEAVPQIPSVWHQPAKGRPAMRVLGDITVDAWGDDSFPVSGQAFLQVNRGAGGALTDHVVEASRGAMDGADPEAHVIDAYSGVGLYGRALARLGYRVTGLELDPAACGAAMADPPEGFEVREGAVETLLGDTLPAELVILNPPRTGLHEDVPGVLVEHGPSRLVYVSCDPATLARDLAQLTPAYRLDDVRCFDLFPQTAHVETVVSLRLDS